MIKSKFNALYIGLLGGLLVPVITFFVFYLVKNTGGSFSMFLSISIEYAILAKLISLAAIPDALLFYMFIWTENNKSAMGVIYALFLICLVVLIIKIIT